MGQEAQIWMWSRIYTFSNSRQDTAAGIDEISNKKISFSVTKRAVICKWEICNKKMWVGKYA